MIFLSLTKNVDNIFIEFFHWQKLQLKHTNEHTQANKQTYKRTHASKHTNIQANTR